MPHGTEGFESTTGGGGTDYSDDEDDGGFDDDTGFESSEGNYYDDNPTSPTDSGGSDDGGTSGDIGDGSAGDDDDDDGGYEPPAVSDDESDERGPVDTGPAGQDPVPDSEPVDPVDGRKTRISGPDAPGNESDGVQREILDPAGEGGERAFDQGDDPFSPNPETEGLEAEFGNLSGEEGATAETVQQLQAEVGQQFEAIDAVDTQAYNIRQSGDGFEAVLTDEGLRRVAEQRADAVAGQTDDLSPEDLSIEVAAGSAFVTADEAAERARERETFDQEAVRDLVSDAERGDRVEGGVDELLAGVERGDRVAVDQQVDEQAGEDLTFGEDYVLQQTDDGLQAVLLPDEQQRQPEGESEQVADLPAPRAERPADEISAYLRQISGLPSERELAADLREATGAPNTAQLRESAADPFEAWLGEDPRQTFERSQGEARQETLEAAASAAELAQEQPARAVAVGLPAALAEPTAAGEAAILGGLVAGAIGVDLAGEIREVEEGGGEPADPGFGAPEISAPEEAPDEGAEIDVPEQRPGISSEIDAPEEAPEAFVEIDVPEQRPDTTGELGTPEPEEPDLTVLRTAQLLGEIEERQRQRRRDVPEEFIPEEEMTIGEIVEPEIDEDRFAEQFVDRPEGGVRTFGEEQVDPETPVEDAVRDQFAGGEMTGDVPPSEQPVVQGVLPDEDADVAGNLLDRVAVDVDAGVEPDLGVDALAGLLPDLDTRARSALGLDQLQLQERGLAEEPRMAEIERLANPNEAVEVNEPAFPSAMAGFGTPSGSGRIRGPDNDREEDDHDPFGVDPFVNLFDNPIVTGEEFFGFDF